MNTGVQSFTDPSSIGPMYPFAGAEILLFILGLIFWLGWHVLHVRGESKEFKQASELYRRVGLEQAMHHGGAGHMATEEEIRTNEVNKAIHELHQRGELEDVLRRSNNNREGSDGGEGDQNPPSSGSSSSS
jgi:hypothetical protein